MDIADRTLGHATAAVDYAATVVASLRSREADLPKGVELTTLHRVIYDLERRHSQLAERYQALSRASVNELAERWQAFQVSYEHFLGRESRRRLEAMEAQRQRIKTNV